MNYKKNSATLFLFFCFSLLKAESYKFENDYINLDLLVNNDQVSEININYRLDENNIINGSLLLEGDQAYFNLKSKKLEFSLFNKIRPKSGQKTKKTININWEINDLKISENYHLKDVIIHLVYKSKFIELSMFDKSKNFEYYIFRNDNGPSPIYLYSNNAGEILKAQKINKEIVDGILFINGFYESGSDYEAILKIKEFEVRKNSKYKALIDSTRILDFISIVKNSKNKFTYMEVPFKKENNKIFIKDGFLVGGIIGFTFNGVNNLKTKTTNIDGFYGPIYMFDQYVDKIPVFNNILTNKKNESLLGTNFTVETIKNETSITINPLTFITPGKTKRIFKIFDFLKKKKTISQE